MILVPAELGCIHVIVSGAITIMNNKLGKYILIIPMLSLVTACAQFGQQGAQNTDYKNMVQNAHTYSDHEKLAHYYDDQAREMEAKAEEKRRELGDYEGHSYSYGKSGQDLRSHAKANLHYYEEAANEAVRQADFHRKIAAGLLKQESEMQTTNPVQLNNQTIKAKLNPGSTNKN